MNKHLLNLCKFVSNSAVSTPCIIVSCIWLGHALGRIVIPSKEPTPTWVWIVSAIMVVVLLSVIVLKYLFIRYEIKRLEARHADMLVVYEAAMRCNSAAAKFRTSGSDVSGSYAQAYRRLCRLSADFNAKHGFEAIKPTDHEV